MNLNKYEEVTIVNADTDMYLALKGINNSEELIGKPIRMIFSNEEIIPELEDRPLRKALHIKE